MTIQFIDTAADLAALCTTLAKSNWLVVDTEFHREKTYYPQLCLIQVANEDIIACIDPQAINDLTPLMDVFYQPEMTLVFHAARQDLELLYLLKASLPQHIFDTQLAATVLGYGEQIGYGNLVKQCLNVELEKGQARTDWRQRPLSDEQIDYAADDVRYLRQLYLQLKTELESLGRLEWLAEDFANLSADETYQVMPDSSWRRIKGAGRLKPKQLAILQKLAEWREHYAVDHDLPRRWVIKDDVMLDLARFAPEDKVAMKKIRGFEQRDIDRHANAIIKQIEAGKLIPQEQWPVIKRPEPLTNQQEALVDVLMGLLRTLCDKQSITPVAVATRKDLEALVRGEQTSLMQGWRKTIAGKQLHEFLQGQLALSASADQLTFQ